MANSDIQGILSALANPNMRASASPVSSPGMSKRQLADLIISNSAKSKKAPVFDLQAAGYKWPEHKGSPSVLSRVVDILSRPMYALTETARRGLEPGGGVEDTLGGLWAGFSGKAKTTGVDIPIAARQRFKGETKQEAQDYVYGKLEDWGPVGGFMAALSMNVAADPLTYTNPLSWYTKLKGTKAVAETGRGASKADAIKDAISPENTLRADIQGKDYLNAFPKELGQEIARRSASSANIIQRTAPAPVSNFNSLVEQAPGFANITRGAKAIAPEIRPSGLDIPNVKLPEPMSPSQIPAMNTQELLTRLGTQAESVTPKLARAQTRLESEALAEGAGYKNLGSAQRAGRHMAAKGVNELPVSAGPQATAAGLKTGFRAEDVVAGIARGDLDFIGKAAPKFAPSARQAVTAEHANLAADILKRQGVVSKTAKPLREFTRKDQANLWNAAFSRGIKAQEGKKMSVIARDNRARMYAYNVLRAAENVPGIAVAAHGGTTGTTLSRIIEELGGPNSTLMRSKHLPKELARAFDTGVSTKLPPEVMDVIQGTRARMAMGEAGKLDSILKNLTKNDSIAEQVLSPGSVEAYRAGIKSTLKADYNSSKLKVRAASAPSAAPVSELTTRQAAYKVISQMQKAKKSVPQQAMDIKVDYFAKAGKYGQQYTSKFGDAVMSQSKAIEKSLLESYAKLGTEIGAKSQGADTILSRLATWSGQKTIRSFYNQQFAQGMAQVGSKAEYLNKMQREFSKDELRNAMQFIQGYGPAVGQSVEAASRMKQIIDIMVDARGMNSIATRGLVQMKELNNVLAQLGSDFRFSNKAEVLDDIGRSQDYSKGMDWLNSWQAAKINDPVEFLYKMDNALELVSHKNLFIDEMISRFGSSKYGSGFTHKVPQIARTQGIYFPEEIAQQMANWAKTESKIFSPNSPFIKHLDKVIGAWKSGVTIYAPAHHIRNMIGDLNLAWWAGVNNPRVYTRASKIIYANRQKYRDLQRIDQLSTDSAVQVASTRGTDVISKTRGGYSMTADQVYLLANEMGILQKAHIGEELIGDPLFKNGLPVTKGRVRDFARSASESRDHVIRIGHFLDILEKSKARTVGQLHEVAREAGQTVRKWHPDGMDLTHAEKTVARRLIPFYSWMRKSTPLIFEALVRSPGKVLAYPKAMYSMQLAMGIQPESYSDPFPIDQIFPDWIKAKNIGPIAQYGASGPAGALAAISAGSEETTFGPGGFGTTPTGYSVINPSNPFMDFFGTYAANPDNPFKGGVEGILQGLTPGIKIPLELTQGRKMLTDEPITDKSRYITDNLPIASIISRMAGADITGDPTKRAERGDINYQREAILNYLTALGITGTGPFVNSATIKEKIK